MSEERHYPRVWIFDRNRRVYKRDDKGRSMGSPIWREHWREVEVIGETSRSWTTRCGRKIPKKGGRDVSFSEEEIDRLAYVQVHRHKLAEKVMLVNDCDTLVKIAAVLGYEPRPTRSHIPYRQAKP